MCVSKNILIKSSLAVILASICHAESPADRAEQVKKQIPTNKTGIENSAETALKAVQPLVSDVRNKKLTEMHKRAMLVRKSSADFQALVAEGKMHPWGEIADQYPAMRDTVERLANDYTVLLNEENPVKRQELEAALILALQPVGPFLQSADPISVDLTLASEQLKELQDLSDADRAPDLDSDSSLGYLTPSFTYALLNIPVSIKIEAPSNVDIYLSSGGGGIFPNGLAMQKIRSNDQGLAETTWISKGDSIGLTTITASSPSVNNRLTYQIDTVQPKLRKLPVLTDIAGKVKTLKNKTLQEAQKNQEELSTSLDIPDTSEQLDTPNPTLDPVLENSLTN